MNTKISDLTIDELKDLISKACSGSHVRLS